MSTAGSGPAPDRVAVIAVHGVGDQGPNETAREVARLLQRANQDTYSAFQEATIDLPVEEAPSTRGESSGAQSASPWFVRSPHVRELASRGGVEVTADIDLTARSIDEAKPRGKAARYASIRLRGERQRADARVSLDVYELYWADLSRLSGFLAQVLGKFYQLLFHLAALGRKTVELAWLREKATGGASRGALTTVTALQTVSEALIGAVLPVLNLCFAAVVLPVLLLLASGTVRLVACALIVAVLAGAVVYLALLKRYARPLKAWSALLPLAAALVSGGVAASLLWNQSKASVALYVLLLVGLLCVAGWLTKLLSDRRSGSGEERWYYSVPNLTAIVGIPLSAALSWWGWSRHLDTPDDAVRIAQTIAFAADGVFYVLEIAWRLLIVAGILLAIGYVWVAVAVRRRDGGGAMRRALWTGEMGFFIPTTLFLIVTIIIWKLLLQLIGRSIPPETMYTPWLRELPGWLLAIFPDLGTKLRLMGSIELSRYVQELSTSASGSLFNFFFYLVAAAVVLLILGLLPSIIAETSPPTKTTKAGSHRLGLWLDDGFGAAKVAGWLGLAALVVILPLSRQTGVIEMIHDAGASFLTGDSVANWIGGLIAGSVAILAAFRRNIFGGAQKALDVALDIDNWLRERPPHRNPRGLILLRYLALLKEVQRQGYDRILVVSHSQGTVVTADLLRYLNATKGLNWDRHGLGQLKGVPIRLLTVGSPLRQLYGLRFPHLYAWGRHLDEAKAELRPPDPAKLGVVVWVNGYRSGDYVGRCLWHSDTAPDRFTPADADAIVGALKRATSARKLRSEFCLGEGAHTHYFDETGTPVGRVIDALVLDR
jgi:hypothetical protein